MDKFSILLVDDEEVSLQGIENGVDWNQLGIETVYKAHRMKTAVRMLESYSIDIVLTDIEMPDGTGIELIRWLREKQPNVINIFYTCHADFVYAQEAVKLGAFDYLLKPIPYPELEIIMKRATGFVREQRKGKALSDILYSGNEESESAIDIVKKYIVDNISFDIQRDELAKLVYLNPDYLSKLFRKQEGMTIGEYILKKRMMLAEQLLKNTELAVSDIGQKVGMSDASYFIKTFKKQIGFTPQQFREKSNSK